jgi:formylglycine-generating enzyme required for sulfatase activity
MKLPENSKTYVRIPPGSYYRGNEFHNLDTFMRELKVQGYREVNQNWYSREFPRHEVVITAYFQMAQHLVTNSDFHHFIQETNYIPTVLKNGTFSHWLQSQHKWGKEQIHKHYFEKNAKHLPKHPVTGVSWTDAMNYAEYLSKITKLPYSLPTEAQWEYVARDGSNDIFPVKITDGKWEGTLDDIAWNIRNSEGITHPVGQKNPNSFGVYDMLGNVWEWCLDSFNEEEYLLLDTKTQDPQRVTNERKKSLKGGSYLDFARSLRPADRFGFDMDSASDDIGFRLIIKPSS